MDSRRSIPRRYLQAMGDSLTEADIVRLILVGLALLRLSASVAGTLPALLPCEASG